MSRKTFTSASLTTPKPPTVWITTNCGKNSSRDGNTRPPYLSPEKYLCRSRSNSQNRTWNNGLVQNWERNMSRLYTVALLTQHLFRVHHVKCLAGWRQAGIKIVGRNINNLRYADDTTLMAESEEELKSLLMKVKEESEKAGLKLSFQNTKIMASGPITSWQIDGETMETLTDLIFLGSKITSDGDCSHVIKRRLLLRRKAMTNLLQLLLSCFSCVRLCATP